MNERICIKSQLKALQQLEFDLRLPESEVSASYRNSLLVSLFLPTIRQSKKSLQHSAILQSGQGKDIVTYRNQDSKQTVCRLFAINYSIEFHWKAPSNYSTSTSHLESSKGGLCRALGNKIMDHLIVNQ